LQLWRQGSHIAPQSPSQQNPNPGLSANDNRTHIQGYELIFVGTVLTWLKKCAAPWDTHACQISSCYLQYCKIWPLTLTLKDDLDFDLSPLKCAAPWATHACQISSWHVFPLIMTIFKLVLDIECFDQISWWLDKINDLKMSSGHLLVLANLQPWPLYILGHSELDIQLDGFEMTCGHLLVLANLHDKLED